MSKIECDFVKFLWPSKKNLALILILKILLNKGFIPFCAHSKESSGGLKLLTVCADTVYQMLPFFMLVNSFTHNDMHDTTFTFFSFKLLLHNFQH